MGAVDEFFDTIVQGERRQGIPDEQIAKDLGISVDLLRQRWPVSPTRRAPRPERPSAPYVPPPIVEDDPVTHYQHPSDDGSALALILICMLLAS